MEAVQSRSDCGIEAGRWAFYVERPAGDRVQVVLDECVRKQVPQDDRRWRSAATGVSFGWRDDPDLSAAKLPRRDGQAPTDEAGRRGKLIAETTALSVARYR